MVINAALAAQVELVTAQNMRLNKQIESTHQAPFRLAAIEHDDALITLYTGFPSYEVLLSFFEFLGPAVNQLCYWGASNKKRQRKRKQKLDPMNQLFMTLVKLKLDLTVRNIGYRFQISQATVSRYFVT